MKSLFSISLILFSGIIYSCSKENHQKSNADCIQTFANANFEILERIADTALPTNVALTSSAVIFKASEKYDSVKWIIGNDARVFRNREVSLIFDDPETINVNLIGFIKRQYQCEGRKIDTVTKQFEIKGIRNSLLPGAYKGIRISNPTDTFTFEIKQTTDPTWYNEYFIYNFPQNCTIWSPPYPSNTGYLISAGAKNFRIRNDLPATQECLFEVYGVGKLKANDSLELDFNYRINQNSPQLTNDKFIGKKL